MPITFMEWASDFDLGMTESLGRDIHVLRGQSTPNLVDRLRVTWRTPTGTSNTAVATYRQTNNDLTITFRPLFKGVQQGVMFEGFGIHVDTTTGIVSVDAAAPQTTKPNFIIEVEARNAGQTTVIRERVRIQIHTAVQRVWLSPGRLTMRRRPGTTAGEAGFVVRAQFDDGVIGDLTIGHGVTWSDVASPPHVAPNGPLVVDPGDPTGAEFQIRAELPAGFGGPAAGARWTATGVMRVERGWHELIVTERPELELVSGSAVPSQALPETHVPNVLFVADGWLDADRAQFVRLTTELVKFLRTTELLRPYPRLTESMYFWRMFVPSATSRISVLSEVSTFPKDGRTYAVPLPPVKPPPATGSFELAHLLYVVGLPLPADAGRTVAELRVDWSTTTSGYPGTSRVTDEVIAQWKALASRTFVHCEDSEFHMTLGEAPRANLRETSFLGMGGQFAGNANLWRAVAGAKSGVALFGPAPAHALWSQQNADFDNDLYVVCFSSMPVGRALANTPVVMTTRDDLRAFRVQPTTSPPGLALTGDEDRLPPDLKKVGLTFAHELAHKFGLGDEYGEFKEPAPDLRGDPNVQPASGLRDPATGRLLGTNILWNWHRIEAAALIEGAMVPQGGSDYAIPVRPGHAGAFRAGDRVLLRERERRGPFNTRPTVSAFELQVLATVSNDTIVVRAPAGTPAAGVQAFPRGSIVFRPVAAPPAIRDATYPYMQLVTKQIRDAVTSDNAPQFTDGCDTDNLGGKQRPSLPGFGLLRCLKDTWRVVGLYEGGSRYTCGIYHPAGYCLMRNNGDDAVELCAVCRYVLADMIDPGVHAEVERAYAEIYRP